MTVRAFISTKQSRHHLSDEQFAIRMLIPVILFALALVAFPVVFSLGLSLIRFNLAEGSIKFVGLTNYSRLFLDPAFHNSLIVTFRFALTTVAASLLFGMGMALLLNEKFWGNNILRILFLLPWMLSEFATAMIWKFLLAQQYGTINGFLYSVGIIKQYQDWFTASHAVDMVALAYTWHVAPLAGMFFLAALQVIPPVLYNAAKIDGAGPLWRFWYVTLPHLRPTLFIVLVITTMEAFRAFDIIYIMTGGGPGIKTDVMSFGIFKELFNNLNLGYAAAYSYVLALLTQIIAIIYFFILGRRRKS